LSRENPNYTDQVLSRFEGLTRALIDSSSIIYIQKAGFFLALAETLALHSLPEMIAETGPPDVSIHLVHSDDSSLTNDEKLIACAQKMKMPVISEDKKILISMRRADLPYFNALMMLNFLLFKRKIDRSGHGRYFRELKKIAWYSRMVWEKGRQIFAAIAALEP
jgi:hypothetical protein